MEAPIKLRATSRELPFLQTRELIVSVLVPKAAKKGVFVYLSFGFHLSLYFWRCIPETRFYAEISPPKYSRTL